MKKILLGFLALMVSMTLFAERVTVEQAAEIAARFTNDQPSLSRMHKAPRKASNMRLAHKALQNNSELEAFYVFNQEGDNGFVIVSADDRTAEEVLGYSENGSFDAEKINPNLKWWLSRYVEEITVLQTIDDSEFIEDPSRKAKQVTAIAPLLVNKDGKEITWYQEAPYSNLLPMDEYDNTRCLTGCVATAASQIMYKWAYPAKGTGSRTYTWTNSYKTSQQVTMTVNYGETTYDWDNMLPAYVGKSSTSAQKTAVATLMYHAGVACKMNYGGDKAGGSGAWTDDMGYGLMTYFGYDLDKFITMYSKSSYQSAKGTSIALSSAEYSVSSTQFTEYFNADLEAGRPILMGGEDSSQGGGHEFVCNGRDASNKFYINWGWEGDGNGYFAITSLKPTGSSYNFSTHLDAIIGLRPGIEGHTVKVSGTGCTVTPSASIIENGNALTATVTPTDGTYDFTSVVVKLGSTTLTQGTHYTLSSDKKTITVLASAITGDASNDLTITVVWTKNRYKYELLGENCTPEETDGTLEKNAALNLIIQPAAGYTLDNAACWDVEMDGSALTYGTGFTYNAASGAFAIAKVTGDVNILAYGSKNITWVANNATHASNLAIGGKLSLPATNPDACDSKVFVGWTAAAGSWDNEPTLVKEGDNATVNTYYAVFATQSGEGGSAVEDKLTRSTTGITGTSYSAWSGKTVTSSAVYAGNSAGGNESIQLRSDNSNSGIVTTASGGKVTKVTVEWNSNTANDRTLDIYGKNSAYSDATDLYDANAGTKLGSIVCGTSTELTISGDYTFVGVRSNNKAMYLTSITFTWGGGASFSDYSTSCTPCELTGITLNTENVQKAFITGSTFSYEGLVVTASYSNCSDKNIVPTSVSAPDMSVAGEKTVTVTYTENEVTKTAEYSITVTDPATYTIRFFNNGALVGTAQSVTEGQQAAKPADPTACDDYTFKGWFTAALADDVTEAPAYVTDFTATKDQDYFAVYSYTEEGEGGGSTTVEDKLTRATTGITGTSYSAWSEKTVTSDAVYAGQSAGGNSSIQLRATSPSGIITTASGGKLKKVVVTWNSNTSGRTLDIYGKTSAYSASSDLYSNSSQGTKLGSIASDSQTELTISGTYTYVGVRSNNGAMYIDDITFVWEAAGSGPSSTTYYTTAPSCEECTSTVTINKGTAEHGSFTLDKSGEISTCSGAVTVTVTATPDKGYQLKEITQTGMTEGVTINQDAKTVTYAKKATGESTISVSFEALPTYTIRFFDKGAQINSQTLYAGEKADKPANPVACEGYTFVGWWTSELATDNTDAKTWITDFTVTADQDYYAIYSKEEGSGSAEKEDKLNNANTVNSTANTYKDWTVSNLNSDAVYAGQSGGENTTIQLRSKNSNSGIVTTTSGGKISKISVEWYSSTAENRTLDIYGKNTAYSNATDLYGNDAGTKLGSIVYGKSTELSITGDYTFVGVRSNDGALFLNYITFTWGGGGTTYYTSDLDCGGTTLIDAIDCTQPAAVKAIRNGQIVIIRGEAVYSITGARIE